MALRDKFYRLLCGCGGLILIACEADPQIPHHNTQNNNVDCTTMLSVNNTSSAEKLTRLAKACTEQHRYAHAAELLVVAGAYAFYNLDNPTHALNALFSDNLGTLKKYQQTNLILAINALDNDPARMDTLCQFLTHSAPASVSPNNAAHNKWQQAMAFVYCRG